MPESLSQAEAARTFESLSGPIVSDVRAGLQAAAAVGKRRREVLYEAFAVAGGPGRLTLQEYFYYRLWDSPLSLSDKLRFVSKKLQTSMHLACNNVTWSAVSEDKILFHAAATGAGLPVPRLDAIVHPSRTLDGVRTASGVKQIQELLSDVSLYPCFIKPINGRYSLGAAGLDFLDEAGSVTLSNGEHISLDQVVEHLALPCGYVVQERLRSDPDIASAFGNRLWSVRAVVLVGEDGPSLLRAVCKVPAPGSMADNFWRPGNMLAAVDIETGTIVRSVRGTADAMEVDFAHPQTGHPLCGHILPRWQEITALVDRASRLLPGIRTQSWDIALTDRGPVILESNFAGDLNLVQLAYGVGVMGQPFASHLQQRGYREPRFDRWAERLILDQPRPTAA